MGCRKGTGSTSSEKNSPSWAESSEASCASTPRMGHTSGSLDAAAVFNTPTPPLLSQKPSNRKFSEEMLSDIFDIVRDHLRSSSTGDTFAPMPSTASSAPSPPVSRSLALPDSPTGPITRSYSAEAPASPTAKTCAVTSSLANTSPLPPAQRPQTYRRYKIGPILEERKAPRKAKLPSAVSESPNSDSANLTAADDIFRSHPLSGLVQESDEESGGEGGEIARARSCYITPVRNVRQGANGVSARASAGGWPTSSSWKGRVGFGLSCAARTGSRASQLGMTASC